MAFGNSLAVTLRKLRGERCLTQAQVAERVGVARATIALWESGARFPRRKYQAAISRLFGIDVRDLVFGKKGDR